MNYDEYEEKAKGIDKFVDNEVSKGKLQPLTYEREWLINNINIFLGRIGYTHSILFTKPKDDLYRIDIKRLRYLESIIPNWFRLKYNVKTPKIKRKRDIL